MLRHRLAGIEYKAALLGRRTLSYAFRSADGRMSYDMFNADSLEVLDRNVKADPAFPYIAVEVIPVVSTVAMVAEASEYLGETILTEDEVAALNFPNQVVEDESSYFLAYKEVRPFSPLLTQSEQNDIHRRTIVSQRSHHSGLEFADDNPVGRSVGILIGRGTLEEIRAHVTNCAVFPDTTVEFAELMTLPYAWRHAAAELSSLGRQVPPQPEWRKHVG
jgi:hypothetical protein